MRCVIARFPFDLLKTADARKCTKPEPDTGESVLIGRRQYPVKQVGEIISGQDRNEPGGVGSVRADHGELRRVGSPGRPRSLHGEALTCADPASRRARRPRFDGSS
ncbi:SCO5918 family protein [Streptomyces sp. NPDC048197]|uniref:SCO5918 family protein n=1 Tax=Streptomyces sp. NPDC048197 TaxID=3365511 RepID=UPI003721B7E2